MIIEVTGVSGVGKTTFIDNLYKDNYYKYKIVFLGHENYTNTNLPKWFLYLTKINFYSDIFLITLAIFNIFINFKFSLFIIKHILFSKYLCGYKLILLRVLFRRIGFFYLLNMKRFSSYIFIIDEGLFHLSHNILCSPNAIASKTEIINFIKLYPLNGKLIILTDDVKHIYKRIIKRGDYSPRIKNQKEVMGFLQNASHLFDIIIHNISYSKCQYLITNINNKSNLKEFLINE